MQMEQVLGGYQELSLWHAEFMMSTIPETQRGVTHDLSAEIRKEAWAGPRTKLGFAGIEMVFKVMRVDGLVKGMRVRKKR